MTYKELIQVLDNIQHLVFQLPNGQYIPGHFHVTEVAKNTKEYIDCGSVQRKETKATFQIWTADDVEHRLSPKKWKSILEASNQLFDIENLKIEAEYQGDTIGIYELSFNGTYFNLTRKFTDCLAQDKCGITPAKEKTIIHIGNSSSTCTPGSGCC
jgi:hypothetical protein